MVARQKGSLVATAWLDNRVVSVLSTNSQPEEFQSISRKQKDGSPIDIDCPQAVVLYSKHMRGVDHNDQYYKVRTKGRKYYKYIFWFLFELVTTNTFILMRQHVPSMAHITVKQFRQTLAHDFIGTYMSRKRPGRVSHLALPPAKRTKQHYATKFHSENKKKAVRCDRCLKLGKRKETTWYCIDCKLHLCHTGELDGSDCFMVHHEDL